MGVQRRMGEAGRRVESRSLMVFSWSHEQFFLINSSFQATEFLRLNIDIMQANVSRFMQTIFMLEKGLPRNEILPRSSNKYFCFGFVWNLEFCICCVSRLLGFLVIDGLLRKSVGLQAKRVGDEFQAKHADDYRSEEHLFKTSTLG